MTLAQIQYYQSYGLGYIVRLHSTFPTVERTSPTQIPENLYAPLRQDYTDMNSRTKDFLDYGKDSRRYLKFLRQAQRLLTSLMVF
jgi:hypothetical protein